MGRDNPCAHCPALFTGVCMRMADDSSNRTEQRLYAYRGLQPTILSPSRLLLMSLGAHDELALYLSSRFSRPYHSSTAVSSDLHAGPHL
eukprot:scaffold282253_cov29-Tisochrysis_lutea.AAC.3